MPGVDNCAVTQTIFYDIILAIATGIVSSLLISILLKHTEKQKAKKILLKNFRFMEAIEESHAIVRCFLMIAKPILNYYGGIEWFHFPEKSMTEQKKSFREDKKCQSDIYSFLDKNRHDVEEIIDIIVSEKNDVLYEAIDKSLGISFNQILCNISDNLKNRAHNFIGRECRYDIKQLLKTKDTTLIYYIFFDILAYVSYLFDLYSFLGVEDKLNHDFDSSLKIMKKSKIR